MDKVELDFSELVGRLKALTLPQVDRVVGVATGGVVPASLVAYQLDLPLDLIQINFRAGDNTPRFESPRVLEAGRAYATPQRLLLVDDVSVSGKTLEAARQLLAGHDVITLVMKGRADYVLFPEIGECVHWPWQMHAAAEVVGES